MRRPGAVESGLTISVLGGVAELVERYDGFILDIWGVLHDGVAAYPGSPGCLALLQAAGRRAVLLSNAPRAAERVAERLAEMGIARGLYGQIVTSGDATVRAIREGGDAWHAGLGEACFYLGPERDRAMLTDCGRRSVALEKADFILCTGLFDEANETPDSYRALFEQALARRLGFVCANPDRVVNRGRTLVYCAGALADLYQEMGGEVRRHGKPDAGVFHLARAALGNPDPARVLVVGDGLDTDLAGAAAAGFDALWVMDGIHAAELGADGKTPDAARVAAFLARARRQAVAVIERLVW